MESQHEARSRLSAAERLVHRACLALNTLSPLLYITGCWLLLLAPQLMQSLMPPVSFFFLRGMHHTSPGILLPPTKHAAWQLGHIHALLSTGALDEAAALQQATAALQMEASQLLGSSEGDAGGLSSRLATVLAAMQASLAAEANRKSALAAFLSFQTVLRLLWLVGIIGICATIGPACYYIFKPLLVHLYHALRGVVLRLRPIAERLGRMLQPLLRPVGFVVCLYIVVAASRYPPSAAMWVALTGHVLAVALYGYSLEGYLGAHGDVVQRRLELWFTARVERSAHDMADMLLVAALAVLAIMPAAVQHESKLLAFLVVSAHFWSAFTGLEALIRKRQPAPPPHPSVTNDYEAYEAAVTAYQATIQRHREQELGWFFKEDPWLWPGVAAALSVLVAWVIVHKLMAPWHHGAAMQQALHAFELAVALYGRAALLIIGLARCQEKDHWKEVNAAYVLVLVSGIAVGWATGHPSLHNTAIVFLVLWAGAKVAEAAEHISREAHYLLWLGFFLALWRVSLFLSTHPAWVASLFGV